MPIPYKYAYLLGTLALMVIWLILFWYRKDLRKEMLIMSILVALIGIPLEYLFWTTDWWRPITITGTRVGIEDFLLGFAHGGITAVIYEELFKKRLYRYYAKPHSLQALLIIAGMFVMSVYFFYVLKFDSFMITVGANIIGGSLLVALRKDLFTDALLTGFCLMMISIPFYVLAGIMFPGIEQIWVWDHLSGIRILNAPLEDLIFYSSSGYFIAPFYLYWKSERLRRAPVKPAYKNRKR